MDYPRAFAEFRRRWNGVPLLLECLRTHPSLRGHARASERVLSVGAGRGELDIQFAATLPRLREYVAIDPSESMLAEFRQSVENNGSKIDPRIFQFVASTFEDYEREGQTFDLILASHCLYYMPERRRQLQRMAEFLPESGVILFILHTEWGSHQVQEKFAGDELRKVMFTSKDLCSILDQLGWSYHCEIVEAFIDLGAVNKALVEFLLVQELSERQYEEVKLWLRREFDSRLRHPSAVITTSPDARER